MVNRNLLKALNWRKRGTRYAFCIMYLAFYVEKEGTGGRETNGEAVAVILRRKASDLD